ncbi:MAG: UDP-N-acetylmuramoyl-tripeptide--D-alanyl-D-alanine ligase [Candidatus Omnitrophica bacterium]|nr:UDP-N-acetylmuramoyl-tripeptide--D-alanyl-D-alanine ligase [Candidatus Omnitrophota bacterium]
MFSFPEASRALRIPLELPNPSSKGRGASIDTRTLEKGNLFIALRGENQDGHRYLEEAFSKGASGAILDKKVWEDERARFFNSEIPYQNLMPAENPALAFGEFAAWHRSHFHLPTIGVTGSVGKTSTKEFLHYLLKQKHKVLANQGNLNNHLGLPLTLLRLEEEHQFLVSELGANHPGEIRTLARMLQPTAGIITRIAPAHLEGFGSLEAIYEAKLELFAGLPPGSVAIIPDDDPVLFEKARTKNLKLIRVGKTSQADYQITQEAIADGRVHFEINRKYHFAFPGIASFLAVNAAMAAAMAHQLGQSWDELPQKWDGLALPSGRFEKMEIRDGIHVIYDGYNANPVSFDKALESFQGISAAGRKILVFADMLELGSEEKKYHEALGKKIASCDFDEVVGYGPRSVVSFETIHREKKNSRARHFETAEEAAHYLNAILKSGDCVLLKASRGMKIETILKSKN